MVARDWVGWHAAYDDPQSGLHRRLLRVQHRVRQALDGCPAGPINVLSMCAGQGRDLIEPLESHPRRADVRGLLVELDARNAEVAERAARAAGLDRETDDGSGLRVLVADAAVTTTYAGVVPVDLALVCGVFGNIPDADVHRTVAYLPRLLRPGGTVIWTRHRRGPDLTPAIRRWFADAGFAESGFDTEPGYHFGVGTHCLAGPALPFEPDVTLFGFREPVTGPSG